MRPFVIFVEDRALVESWMNRYRYASTAN